MEQPDSFVDNLEPEKICYLKRAIYGLKQASWSCHVRLDKMLTSVGFKKSNHDPCIYVKPKRNRIMTVIPVYTDDFFVFSNDCSEKARI
jgi:hypothetical protein